VYVLSQVAQAYPRSGIRRMFDLAAKYDDVVSLCLGEPNFDTPSHIVEAAKVALDQGLTHYTPNAGMVELRQAIADKYEREYGLKYSVNNVMITVGAMEALYLSLATIVNPGDEVIVPDPCFPSYLGQVMMLGAKVVPVPVREENVFKLKADDVEKAVTPKTKAVLLNSPSNPLGAILEKEDLEALAQVANRHNLLVISDEVYEKIMYDGRFHYSIAQIPGMKERTIVINSFSKTYAMTGWRVGYLLAGKEIVQHMPKLQEGIASCLPAFMQKAAVEALNGNQESVCLMVNDYTRRRSILIDGLNQIPGFHCQKSPGTFYAFPNIKAFGISSQQFAEELLREARVVTVPGSAFGGMGEGYLRLSFANSDENLQEAVRRIAEYVNRKY
jgi:aminotransferase